MSKPGAPSTHQRLLGHRKLWAEHGRGRRRISACSAELRTCPPPWAQEPPADRGTFEARSKMCPNPGSRLWEAQTLPRRLRSGQRRVSGKGGHSRESRRVHRRDGLPAPVLRGAASKRSRPAAQLSRSASRPTAAKGAPRGKRRKSRRLSCLIDLAPASL